MLLTLNSIEEIAVANIHRTLTLVFDSHVGEIEVDQIVIQTSIITQSIQVLSSHPTGLAVVG